MPLTLPNRRFTEIFTTVLFLVGLVTSPLDAHGQTCENLFESRAAQNPIHESWKPFTEQDYAAWLKDFQADGDSATQNGLGHALYTHWRMAPEVTAPLLKLGLKIVEPTPENPNEVPRFVFPKTFEELAKTAVADTFKFATYNGSYWLPMEKAIPLGVKFGAGQEIGTEGYAQMVAAGYVPLYPSKRSMLLMHDLGHVSEFREFPAVFPALKTFFSRYLEEGWARTGDYGARSEIFNEVSYILRPEKYKNVDSLLVTGTAAAKNVETRATEIFDRLSKDREGTLNQVYRLTSRFNELFSRHGGGSRDIFNLESRFLSVETVTTFVDKMIRNPADGNYKNDAVSKDALIEFLESLEGINRQVQYVSERLLRNSGTEDPMTTTSLDWYLSYRLAQLEVAIVQQRLMNLSQVDIIQDSMLPTGSESKTRTYFQSFQPKGSRHFEVFVGR